MSNLPSGLVDLLLDIETATRTLSDAAVQCEPEAMREAIQSRGEAVLRLRAAIDDARAMLDDDAKRELEDWSGDISSQAEQTEQALQAILESTRGAIQELGKGMRAARAYQPLPEESLLDRSR